MKTSPFFYLHLHTTTSVLMAPFLCIFLLFPLQICFEIWVWISMQNTGEYRWWWGDEVRQLGVKIYNKAKYTCYCISGCVSLSPLSGLLFQPWLWLTLTLRVVLVPSLTKTKRMTDNNDRKTLLAVSFNCGNVCIAFLGVLESVDIRLSMYMTQMFPILLHPTEAFFSHETQPDEAGSPAAPLGMEKPFRICPTRCHCGLLNRIFTEAQVGFRTSFQFHMDLR